MTILKTNLANALKTKLTADMLASELSASVASTQGLTSPCYLIADPLSTTNREVVLFDGTFDATTLVTTTIENRYLAGSAALSGLKHEIGTEVWCAPLAQHIDDLHDRIDAICINVKDFGAVGDGVTDDTAAVNAAIAFGAAAGGVVFFPAGMYHVTTLAVIAADVTLLGTGCVSTTAALFGDGSYASDHENGSWLVSAATSGTVISSATAVSVGLVDIGLKGVGANTRTTVGVSLDESQARPWSNVTILNFSTGAQLATCDEGLFAALTTRGNGIGVDLSSCNALQFPYFSSSADSVAVSGVSCGMNNFDGATIQGFTSRGVLLGGGCEENQFNRVYFESSTAAANPIRLDGTRVNTANDSNSFLDNHYGDVGKNIVVTKGNGNLFRLHKYFGTLTFSAATVNNQIHGRDIGANVVDGGDNIVTDWTSGGLLYRFSASGVDSPLMHLIGAPALSYDLTTAAAKHWSMQVNDAVNSGAWRLLGGGVEFIRCILGDKIYTYKNLVLADATDIEVAATTGSSLGSSTSKTGAYGLKTTRPSAFTQTYTTGNKTVANPTAATPASITAATPATTATTVSTADGTDPASVQTLVNALKVALNQVIADNVAMKTQLVAAIADVTAARAQVVNVIADHLDTKKNLTSVIDDLQAEGWLQ